MTSNRAVWRRTVRLLVPTHLLLVLDFGVLAFLCSFLFSSFAIAMRSALKFAFDSVARAVRGSSFLSGCVVCGGLVFKSFRQPGESRGNHVDRYRPARLRSLRHIAPGCFLRRTKRLGKCLRAFARSVRETRSDHSDIQDEGLSRSGQSWRNAKTNVRTPCSCRAVTLRSLLFTLASNAHTPPIE